jgi:hypothetical protein
MTWNGSVDNEYMTAGNWNVDPVDNQWSYGSNTLVFDNSSLNGSNNMQLDNWSTPTGGYAGYFQGYSTFDFSRTGGFTIGSGIYGMPWNINVTAPYVYTIAGTSQLDAGGPAVLNVVSGGTLQLGRVAYSGLTNGPVQINGGGTVSILAVYDDQGSGRSEAWAINGTSTLTVNNDYGIGFSTLTGTGTLNVVQGPTTPGWASMYTPTTIDASGFTFTGQINASYSGVKVINGPISNLNLNISGVAALYGNNATYINSTIAGSGGIGNDYLSNGPSGVTIFGGSFVDDNVNGTITLQGSTLKPTNGVMMALANLVLAKNGKTDSTLQFAVTGTHAVAGTDFTQLNMIGLSWASSTHGTIANGEGTVNVFQDTTLVVNIAAGLSKGVHSTADLGTANDPFATQSLSLVVSGNDLTGSSFDKIKIIGGSATVTCTNDGNGDGIVTLTNIFSNPTLAGDINNDGLVDVADYNIWAANVGKTGASWLQGDLNGDGLVDVADYNIWAANVGKTAATPEPISMIILAIGGGLVALKRRNG